MKSINLIPAILLLCLFGCTQPDSAKNDPLPLPVKDTTEYFSFVVNGDSVNNESVKLLLTPTKRAFFYVFPNNGGTVSFRLVNASNSSETLGYMDINSKMAGSFPFSENKTFGGFNFQGLQKFVNLKSKSGLVIINHFPDTLFDYLTGTFTGNFYTIGDTTKIYTITNGEFRFKRTTP